ncbi:MAG: hypothetical protein QM482_07115 [Sulfurospirillum sp.]
MIMQKMKKVEIITEGSNLEMLKRILGKIDIPGYTIFHNLEGMGKHGFHEGHLLFNDEDALVMLMSVVEPGQAEDIALGLEPFLQKHSGAIFLSDTIRAKAQKN